MLNSIGYDGPISVEWEDAGMDRTLGAPQAVSARTSGTSKSSALCPKADTNTRPAPHRLVHTAGMTTGWSRSPSAGKVVVASTSMSGSVATQ